MSVTKWFCLWVSFIPVCTKCPCCLCVAQESWAWSWAPGNSSTRLPGEAASVPAAQTPVSPLRSEHDVLSQTGPVRDERTGPERSRHGPAAPVGGISRYGPELTEHMDPFLTKPPEWFASTLRCVCGSWFNCTSTRIEAKNTKFAFPQKVYVSNFLFRIIYYFSESGKPECFGVWAICATEACVWF